MARRYSAFFTLPNSEDLYSIPFNIEEDYRDEAEDDLSSYEVGEIIVSGIPGAVYSHADRRSD